MLSKRQGLVAGAVQSAGAWGQTNLTAEPERTGLGGLLLCAGIPKFYRWLSERYPLLNQKLTLTEGPPEMDNLYLDMNGIIHNCTHANRKDIGGVTEEDMMLKVFDYLDKLVQIVRPQKLLFMAIDGGEGRVCGLKRAACTCHRGTLANSTANR